MDSGLQTDFSLTPARQPSAGTLSASDHYSACTSPSCTSEELAVASKANLYDHTRCDTSEEPRAQADWARRMQCRANTTLSLTAKQFKMSDRSHQTADCEIEVAVRDSVQSRSRKAYKHSRQYRRSGRFSDDSHLWSHRSARIEPSRQLGNDDAASLPTIFSLEYWEIALQICQRHRARQNHSSNHLFAERHLLGTQDGQARTTLSMALVNHTSAGLPLCSGCALMDPTARHLMDSNSDAYKKSSLDTGGDLMVSGGGHPGVLTPRTDLLISPLTPLHLLHQAMFL